MRPQFIWVASELDRVLHGNMGTWLTSATLGRSWSLPTSKTGGTVEGGVLCDGIGLIARFERVIRDAQEDK